MIIGKKKELTLDMKNLVCPGCGNDFIVAQDMGEYSIPMCLRCGNTSFDSSKQKENIRKEGEQEQ